MGWEYMFRPGSIGTLRIKNRIVMPAMSTNFASACGEPTPHLIAYYAARARGGTGLVIVENANVDYPLGSNGAVQLRIDHDRYIPGLYRLATAIRAEGAAAAIQINHAGGLARPERIEIMPVGPSALSWSEDRIPPRPLLPDEIEGIIDSYALAAVRAMRAGFDAVEIHGAHGYLIAQFLSPLTNHRSDGYGGSRENRWRFAIEIIRRVRKAVGPDFPILFRISGDEYLPGGRTIEETVELAPALAEAGADAIHVSAGTAANPEKQLEPISYPEAWRVDLAAAVKGGVDIPVIAVGVLRRPETVERVLADGKADFVAIGRGLIADPSWPEKAERGAVDEIKHCISCNRCTRRRVFDDLPISCSINPAVGREGEPLPKPASPKKIVIVGGGPGGLQAAATGASLGHRVTLLEKEDRLGGRLRLAAAPPHKEKIDWVIDDLIAGLPPSVDLRTGTRATVAGIAALRPDAVILATGATPARLDVPGAELPHVVTADALLRDRIDVAERPVVVIGAGLVGCETALHCASSGARRVTILEALAKAAGDCEPITRGDLLTRLKERRVEIYTGVRVREITTSAVEFEAAGRLETLPAELVVTAVGAEADHRLEQGLQGRGLPVYVIGDARKPRGIYEAINEGWLAAMKLSEEGGRWNG